MAVKRFEGSLKADGVRFGIVVSRFNNFLTDKLVEGALDCIKRHGGAESDVSVACVPGAFEIPYAAAKMVKSGRYDSVICLGALIRGHTPHFDYIANEATKGVAKLALDSGLPVIYGLITADTLEQAIERAGTKAGNKGWQAAEAAIEMVSLYKAMA
ncbi:MAG: 6,7-dimethyl-8-ribityllumazine synthase [candidate division Zixibacteria bacterium]|jgi:6,7-dimethyl-8-ribityllumazine synthase|nr:6,7-dimethyl-8-ribityllumazine synthase [candidate division Zixibacteria bacterium]